MLCKPVSSIYSFTMCALCIIRLKHIIVIWEMTCNNVPNKVINDFNIFLGINITLNNRQSTHTFIGDAAPDHQTYTHTTTWIQAWRSPFFAVSSPNKYVPCGCAFPILPYIHHYKSPSFRNHLQFCAYSIYTMTAVFDIVVTNSDALFTTLVIFCFIQFSLNSLTR